MMSQRAAKQKIALNGFTQISDVLAVPTIGKALPDERKWTLPCPDKKALADYPEAKEKQDQWLKEWTLC